MGATILKSAELYVLNEQIICFSGKIGSGKTSVSRLVAQRLNWRRAAFGEYVRHLVLEMGGDTSDRQLLQDIGQNRVSTDVEGFCRDLLEYSEFESGENLIIDGVRHVPVLDAIMKIFDSQPVYLIHLEAPSSARESRVVARGDQVGDFDRASKHIVERDLSNELPGRADVIVNASAKLEVVVSDCLDQIDKLMTVSR